MVESKSTDSSNKKLDYVLFLEAVKSGDKQQVNNRLNKGVDFNKKDSAGHPPLFYAKNIAVVKLLITAYDTNNRVKDLSFSNSPSILFWPRIAAIKIKHFIINVFIKSGDAKTSRDSAGNSSLNINNSNNKPVTANSMRSTQKKSQIISNAKDIKQNAAEFRQGANDLKNKLNK